VPGGTANWSFAGNGNYNSENGSVEISIGKANASITVSGYSVTYDGAAHTATGTAIGVNGESLAGLNLSGTTHTTAGSYNDSWTFTDVTGNYNNTSSSISDSIAKAEANVVVNGYTGVYDGAAHGATGSATGVNSENLSSLLNLGASFTNVPGGTADWTFAGNGNYNAQSGSVAITINKANATISVIGYSLTYDGAAHTATGSATGVNGETLAGLNLSGTTHTTAGSYIDTWTFTTSPAITTTLPVRSEIRSRRPKPTSWSMATRASMTVPRTVRPGPRRA
jgi:hypothetical protein